MYLHIGQDVAVLTRDIVGVFDLDNCTQSKDSRAFLNAAEKSGRVVVIGEDIPRSAVLTEGRDGLTVYLSQISPGTLRKRTLNTL